ncbi:hypothetical protein [Lysinibacillus telephonicus]|uniref:hypothetical protein n=1 Tax=Lysinibacillus telephonicus TaxID=1714840 RepID=UPI003BA3787B
MWRPTLEFVLAPYAIDIVKKEAKYRTTIHSQIKAGIINIKMGEDIKVNVCLEKQRVQITIENFFGILKHEMYYGRIKAVW